jgi:hypothetical protein
MLAIINTLPPHVFFPKLTFFTLFNFPFSPFITKHFFFLKNNSTETKKEDKMRSIPTTMLNTHPNNTHTSTITHSLWQTPIPYLFGGLAVIMGLIALALLALSCSFCKLSRNNQDGDHNDLDNKESDPQTKEPIKAYEEKILVIMAGNETPTFLATPVVLSIIDKEIDNLVLVPATSSPQENQGSCSSQHAQKV